MLIIFDELSKIRARTIEISESLQVKNIYGIFSLLLIKQILVPIGLTSWLLFCYGAFVSSLIWLPNKKSTINFRKCLEKIVCSNKLVVIVWNWQTHGMKCQSNLHYSEKFHVWFWYRGIWLVVEMNTKLFLGKFRRPIPVTSYKPSVGVPKLYNRSNFTS